MEVLKGGRPLAMRCSRAAGFALGGAAVARSDRRAHGVPIERRGTGQAESADACVIASIVVGSSGVEVAVRVGFALRAPRGDLQQRGGRFPGAFERVVCRRVCQHGGRLVAPTLVVASFRRVAGHSGRRDLACN
ncbi:hypothetical protein [Burkholderia multivorans]|uniref:hypothetical protein n=1 Tax=Burkholderia multivorans TaxID=87883 RepID=UPI0012D360BE|nr:hypothetical protein [Burkholderia multivorans]